MSKCIYTLTMKIQNCVITYKFITYNNIEDTKVIYNIITVGHRNNLIYFINSNYFLHH